MLVKSLNKAYVDIDVTRATFVHKVLPTRVNKYIIEYYIGMMKMEVEVNKTEYNRLLLWKRTR